ncbi:MAG: DUF4446 family protein [Epulopiscium sp.]|nr:DUF4446 family protein [Candidatus Epulonipiscium sp.]
MVYMIIGLIATSFLFLILIIILFAKNRKLKNRYNEFMKGSEVDIETLLRESIERSADIQDSYKYIRDSIDSIQTQLKNCVQKVGIVRYNAVSGVGSDLCFAVALLDEEDTGVVINGIYTRDGSYTYAKEVTLGSSKHILSDEEKEAIKRAQEII